MNNQSRPTQLQLRSTPKSPSVIPNFRWLKPALKVGVSWLLLVALTALSPTAFSSQKEGQKEGKKGGKEQKERKEKKEPSESQMLTRPQGEARKAPEGATISGNAVTLQAGYQFVKQSNGNFAVRRASGGVSGEFKCSCKSTATTKGSCDFSLLGGTTATCNNNGCNDCRLDIVVTGSQATAAAAAGKNGTIKQIK